MTARDITAAGIQHYQFQSSYKASLSFTSTLDSTLHSPVQEVVDTICERCRAYCSMITERVLMLGGIGSVVSRGRKECRGGAEKCIEEVGAYGESVQDEEAAKGVTVERIAVEFSLWESCLLDPGAESGVDELDKLIGIGLHARHCWQWAAVADRRLEVVASLGASGMLNSTGRRRRKASVAVMPSALPSRTYLVGVELSSCDVQFNGHAT
ncbi:unnamed protein product [Alternaria burnsii]|nr:unnamed protein product [Alternaria burnsii]